MIGTILCKAKDRKTRGLALAAGGMGALMVGCKTAALGMFGAGVVDLERQWRQDHNFQGNFAERWQRALAFYDQTHRHPVNRGLHIAGIPLILGGAIGLILHRPLCPLWSLSAAAFGTGWILNLVGHAVFEKNRPAFADDPLSFVAGPVWDVRQLRG